MWGREGGWTGLYTHWPFILHDVINYIHKMCLHHNKINVPSHQFCDGGDCYGEDKSMCVLACIHAIQCYGMFVFGNKVSGGENLNKTI